MSEDRDLERRLDAWFEDEARPMPPPVLEAVIEAVPRASRRSAGNWFPSSPVARRALTLALTGALVVGALAAGPQLIARIVPADHGVGAGPGSCVRPPAGLTGWWPGEGSGRDLVGGRDAATVGNATFAPGLVGQAFTLDGHGDFASVADAPALDPGVGDFSVDLWVRFNDTSGEQVLVEKWVQRFDGSSVGWTLTKLADNRIGFYTESPRGAGGTQSGIDASPAQTWLNVAARRRGPTFELLVNGVLIASNDGDPAETINLDSTASLKFGHRGGPDDTPGSQDQRGFFLNGQIDEVELFVGRALSDDEVARIYLAGAAGACRP